MAKLSQRCETCDYYEIVSPFTDCGGWRICKKKGSELTLSQQMRVSETGCVDHSLTHELNNENEIVTMIGFVGLGAFGGILVNLILLMTLPMEIFMKMMMALPFSPVTQVLIFSGVGAIIGFIIYIIYKYNIKKRRIIMATDSEIAQLFITIMDIIKTRRLVQFKEDQLERERERFNIDQRILKLLDNEYERSLEEHDYKMKTVAELKEMIRLADEEDKNYEGFNIKC